MILEPLEKLILTEPLKRPQNGRVIGIKPEPDNSTTYFIEPLRVDFGRFKNGSRIIRLNSKDIDKQLVIIQKHIV